MHNSTPIVVVAYNRPRSLSRLLSAIGDAFYPDEKIDLIISIDGAEDNQDVLAIAEDFEWPNGPKTVTYHEQNLGLRNHIIKCGALSVEFGSVILLEDDLYVSPNFYMFAVAALRFSSNKDNIGGVSLYNHKLNVHTKDHFEALEDGYDNWYFQFASSWGQAWTGKQWSGFMDWYKDKDSIEENPEIPKNVSDWSDKSWLKFFIAYLIEKDKFFLYPRLSMSTNFSDSGTHMGSDSTIYQVSLLYAKKTEFHFSTVEQSNSVYDAFFDNRRLAGHLRKYELEIEKDGVCTDLYAYKKGYDKKYVLTTKILNYKIISSFAKSLKPIDANIVAEIPGQDIFLYDTGETKRNPHKPNRHKKLIYNLKSISIRDSWYLCKWHIKRKMVALSGKILGKN